MESKEKVELIQVAIQKLIEEQREKQSSLPDASGFVVSDDGGDDHHLLSKLLSQLETLKRDGKIQQSEPLGDPEELSSLKVGEAESEIANEVVGGAIDDSEREEIVRELRKVKRQNFITHCLLSVMIVLTVAWQLSEVSLVLKVKDGLSHPFRSFGGMLAGMLKKGQGQGPIAIANDQNGQLPLEATPLPPLQIPELPNLDLSLGTSSDEE